jgi:coenzyme Q-binding protein COQ10
LSRYTASASLPYSCEQLFTIAAGIEQYPKFLPGWIRAQITERSENRLVVNQSLGFGLLRTSFISSARLEWPHSVHVSSADGPFESMEIQWHFTALDEGLCRVSLDIELLMNNPALAILADHFFRSNAQQTVARFSRRAQEVYGSNQSGEVS